MKKPKKYKSWVRKRKESLVQYYNGTREPTKSEIERRKILQIRHPPKKIVCEILKEHHNDLKNDPEHLHTEFLENLIGVSCQNKIEREEIALSALSRIRFVDQGKLYIHPPTI